MKVKKHLGQVVTIMQSYPTLNGNGNGTNNRGGQGDNDRSGSGEGIGLYESAISGGYISADTKNPKCLGGKKQ